MCICRERDGKYGGILTNGESGEGYIGLMCTILETEISLCLKLFQSKTYPQKYMILSHSKNIKSSIHHHSYSWGKIPSQLIAMISGSIMWPFIYI